MSHCEELRSIVEGVIRVLHTRARQLERFAGRAEQLTGHLGCATEFGIAASGLGGLLFRVNALGPAEPELS